MTVPSGSGSHLCSSDENPIQTQPAQIWPIDLGNLETCHTERYHGCEMSRENSVRINVSIFPDKLNRADGVPQTDKKYVVEYGP